MESGSGSPISGATIGVYYYDLSLLKYMMWWSALSGTDGTYRIAGIPLGGEYMVSAVALATDTDYIVQYYNGRDFVELRDKVTLTTPELTGINFQLRHGAGSMSGHVSDNSGTPIAYSFLVLYTYDGTAWIRAFRGISGADGSYNLWWLKPGDYRVKAYAPGYVPEWYEESPTEADAKLVTISALTNTPDIDFTLAPTPVAEAGGPYLVPAGLSLTLNGVAYYDPERPIVSFQWDFGDGSTGNGASANHIYQAAGIYTATLTVTDNNGVSGTDTAMVVVYDPSAGFVTGGGWINSPAGAYAANPSLTGKATFGFVSRYQKGAEVPTGQTEFQFQIANLNFHSDSYDWMVVAGAKAQYKGTGTINGVGAYRFMLTAIDGDLLAGGKGPDKFRMRIWGDNGLIYDNQLNAPDTDEPTTVIGGGNIVIHK
jgi:hypothetical protein